MICRTFLVCTLCISVVKKIWSDVPQLLSSCEISVFATDEMPFRVILE
jgi:hypothetical protein